MPHEFNEDTEWPPLWDEPGEPVSVRDLVGNFGALNQYGTMSVQIVVAGEGVVDERLVGALMHPEIDGVMVATMEGTRSGEVSMEEMTELLRELGWRWATEAEVLQLWKGYLLPGLAGAPRLVDGTARADALRDLT